tara:strand:- start:314 stop:493 length:180 start_codon:yes stop_codon:yes gene_type:complete
MNKLIRLKNSSLKENYSNEENFKEYLGDKKIEKVLCNHCGRTASNGIRCMGICVADNEY